MSITRVSFRCVRARQPVQQRADPQDEEDDDETQQRRPCVQRDAQLQRDVRRDGGERARRQRLQLQAEGQGRVDWADRAGKASERTGGEETLEEHVGHTAFASRAVAQPQEQRHV